MKRACSIVVLIILVGCICYEFGTESDCDGWYGLTVVIEENAARNVSGVSFLPVSRADMADAIVDSIDEQLRIMEYQDSVDPFTVKVGFSYRESILGRRWGHAQEYSHIIVVLHDDNEPRRLHRLVIPHRDDSRRITVNDANAI